MRWFRRILRFPAIRQELVDLAQPGLADPGQDGHEVLLWVEAVALGAGQEGVEAGVGLTGGVVPGEEPVLAADGDALGFTLIELSIALVIIGLIVGGVLAGRELVAVAEIRKDITTIESIDTAVYVFKLKYNALPGDMSNATRIWSKKPGTDCQNFVRSLDQTTCDGDGDGTISGTSLTSYWEPHCFWQHLSNAGLIGGNYSCSIGDPVPLGKVDVPPLGMRGTVIHAGHGYYSRIDATYSVIWEGHIYFTTQWDKDTGTILPALTPLEAFNIDRKMDDGNPETGRVRDIITFTFLDLDPCSEWSDPVTAASYHVENPDLLCSPMIVAPY